MSKETNISADFIPEVMMHLCLTLTPRIPGYPTGPWAPGKPYKKTTVSSLLLSSIQQKMHFSDQIWIGIALSHCVLSFIVNKCFQTEKVDNADESILLTLMS